MSAPPARQRTRAPLPEPLSNCPNWLGPAPVTGFENKDQYDALFADLVGELRPNSAVEWIWTKDIADLAWESRRLRFAKTTLINLVRRKAINTVLANSAPQSSFAMGPSLDEDRVAELTSGFLSSGPGSNTEMTQRLAKSGLDENAFAGQAMREALSELERIDRLIAGSDLRRDAIIRDLARWRERRGPRLPQVVDVAFEPTGA